MGRVVKTPRTLGLNDSAGNICVLLFLAPITMILLSKTVRVPVSIVLKSLFTTARIERHKDREISVCRAGC